MAFDVRTIYLDHNSTTPIDPHVMQAMLPFLSDHFGDPAATYSLGRATQEALEDARGRVAELLGADRDEIVFTSGGTESNQLAIVGTLLANAPEGGHVAFSTVEHRSVSQLAPLLQRLGYSVSTIGVNGQGQVSPAAVEQALRPDTVLVSVLHANDETGVLQPLRQISKICREADVLLHTDASQTVGRMRTLVDELEVDLLTLSGHKMYAAKGIGALYVRGNVKLQPLQPGEYQEQGLRGGMPNVAGAVGLGKACELAYRTLDEAQARSELLRNRLEVPLQETLGEKLQIIGQSVPRLPNTSCLAFSDVEAQEMAARMEPLCVSHASASSSSGPVVSPTLAAMKIPANQCRGILRVSSGRTTTEDEIDRAVQILLDAWENLR